MVDFKYGGSELEVFAHATNWKRYWRDLLVPFLRGDALEVGSGIGANTGLLAPRHPGRWTSLEPDRELLDEARRRLAAAGVAHCCTFECGTVRSLEATRIFDTVLYLDVLEHIENDRLEMEHAAQHLAAGGRIVVLAPAHQALFTEFDHAVGHFRRYGKQSLAAVAPAGLRCERLFYVDSVGLCASLANRLFLRQRIPSLEQITFWDRAMVPISRAVDPLLLRSVGKSIIGVWRKPS
ncbi:MAG: class I SAM-dependent methyltransferase [Deltaproteobacteria bacterium]|nr:MAG: class I SAM-dependent methyltransferase [Deltaproteobacteria bacterium]